MYLLDTNVVSELRRSKPHKAVVGLISAIPAGDLVLPAVTVGEVQAGIEITREQDRVEAEELERWLEQVIASLAFCRWMPRPSDNWRVLNIKNPTRSSRTP